MEERLQRGFEEYGDSSFDRPDSELEKELEEELLDVIGWAYLRLCKLWDSRARRA